MVRIFLVMMLLSACAPQHPLTYVDPGDPVWQLNPPATAQQTAP